MGKAIVEPEELRRFAQDLKRFNNEMKNQMQILNGRFISLGQSWRDQEQRKFAQQFEDTMRTLNRFMEASVEQIPFLLRKAEQIDEYLR
ncbi:MAG: WXG100 family type VII secretion target [Planctomycetota bacterium]|nr:WXG100 family type VII secretion target [Planctomycetota bacterium]